MTAANGSAPGKYFPRMGIDPAEFRHTCASFATGVSVVTALGEDGPSGMTANAITSLSLDPPLMLVCFAEDARTLRAVKASRRFGVQFLATGQEELAARFASKAPEDEKFEGVKWSERSGVPSLDGALGWIGCELRDLLPGGDHLIGVGEVVDMWHVQGEPLVFFAGDYWHLARPTEAPPEVDEALEGP
jgi:3-hydroxy-9,10-secoandrosta-1,3,5(10)-triene-9,17-dione monooxygenase reductase component